MPIKDHHDSYRNLNGERWVCFADIDEDKAKPVAKSLRDAGVGALLRPMHDGSPMRRLFVRESELLKASDCWATRRECE